MTDGSGPVVLSEEQAWNALRSERDALRRLCRELVGAVSFAKMAVDDYMREPEADHVGLMIGAQYRLAAAKRLAQESLPLWCREEPADA